MVFGGFSLGGWVLVDANFSEFFTQADATDALYHSAARDGENVALLTNARANSLDSIGAVNVSQLELNVSSSPRSDLGVDNVLQLPVVELAHGNPPLLRQALEANANLVLITDTVSATVAPTIHITFTAATQGTPLFRNFYAAATYFNTLESNISSQTIRELWQTTDTEFTGSDAAFSRVVVLEEDLSPLTHLLGEAGTSVTAVPGFSDVVEAVKGSDRPLALLPFELLEPTLAVLAVDDENPVENSKNFDESEYALVVDYHLDGLAASSTVETQLQAALRELPQTNRDPSKLTVVAMTGVTAMVRGTAAQMDRYGAEWPATHVGPELASADITHISNEVPFVPGCETNTSPNNLIFCSPPHYMATLELCGVDVIGLTGNHQNDYGREDALKSLEIYAKAGLPVYGGGINKEAAFAPHYIEHNGNKLAFLGANSYGPDFAWATDESPGSAEFDLNIMSATIRNIKKLGRASVVLVELQYQETYDMTPLIEQRVDFNALVRAGADIVTGVQSHVPQALEFTDGKLILYGLGNLFFDQMWSRATREGLVVKHTIYDGRHISTRLLPTLLHDFGQPQWATPEERDYLLSRVFQASYWE